MINKTKNVMITATLTKADSEALDGITKELSNTYGFELTKSQTISILIRQYKANSIMQPSIQKQDEKKQKRLDDIVKYQSIILALKDKLGLSYNEMADLTGICKGSLIKFKNGDRVPGADNQKILNEIAKRYNIKL